MTKLTTWGRNKFHMHKQRRGDVDVWIVRFPILLDRDTNPDGDSHAEFVMSIDVARSMAQELVERGYCCWDNGGRRNGR
jgi:hypothetical protein